MAKDVRRRLSRERKRHSELNRIIKKLYESFATGRISDERFDTLLTDYKQEQKTLRQSISEAEISISNFEKDTARVDCFPGLVKKYIDFSELTTTMINEFIDRIIVHAPDCSEGDRTQEVEIYLKYIGRFEAPVPEPTPEEVRRQEQLRRHRVKSRERYQMIKADEHAVGQPFKLICKCCGKVFESKCGKENKENYISHLGRVRFSGLPFLVGSHCGHSPNVIEIKWSNHRRLWRREGINMSSENGKSK